MTPDGKAQADVILPVLQETLAKILPFYDCKIVLGVFMGQVGVLAATLRAGGILSHEDIIDYFAAGLKNAMAEVKAPTIRVRHEGDVGVKQ